MGKALNLPTISPKLERIAELAKADSKLILNSFSLWVAKLCVQFCEDLN